MTRPWLVFEVARATIELESPSRVGANEGDELHDAIFVSDANGLPAIPGESLAGVLRHALAGEEDPAKSDPCRSVFGYQDRDAGEASAVRVSWAQVHGGDDRPVAFCHATLDDPVLAFLAAGVPRDHVRIGPHGAADGRGKFDELLVPAGARFTFEIVVDGRSPLRAAEILNLLRRPGLRIGGNTRRGLGRPKVVRVRGAGFDLRDRAQRDRYSRLPVPLEDGDGGVLEPLELPEAEPDEAWAVGTLHLEPEGTWLVGGTIPSGREPERDSSSPKKRWDRFPFTERRIVWTDSGQLERGEVVESRDAPLVLPASSVKGALRHRAAFHARRLAGRWLEPTEADPGFTGEERELFGEIRDEEGGRPGRLLLDDARVAVGASLAPLQHVCLDRFTQGPRDKLLFDEVAVCGGSIEIGIALRTAGLSSRARSALACALEDLCGGRLALGAGRSHGRFRGRITWHREGRWMEEARR